MRCTYSYAHVCRRKVLHLILHMKKQKHEFSVLIRILQFTEKKNTENYNREEGRGQKEKRGRTHALPPPAHDRHLLL